jgi:CRP-like cAMP-binding protein
MQTISNVHNYIDPLPEKLRKQITEQSAVRQLAKNEPVYQLGSKANEMYQVISGAIRLSNFSVDGKEMAMGTFFQGDCFGELGIIDGSPRLSVATATVQSSVMVISEVLFHQLYQNHPEFLRELNRVFAYRIRILYGLVEDANVLSLRERLARTLLRLAHGPTFNLTETSTHLPTITASQEELGSMLGASRQSINKELKQLQEEGVLTIAYGKIRITDIEFIRHHYGNIMGTEQIMPAYIAPKP